MIDAMVSAMQELTVRCHTLVKAELELPCRLRQLVCVQKDEAILEHSNEPLQALEGFLDYTIRLISCFVKAYLLSKLHVFRDAFDELTDNLTQVTLR